MRTHSEKTAGPRGSRSSPTVLRWLGTAAALLSAVPSDLGAQSAAKAPGDSASNELFERKIRPVLVEKCFECHSGEARSLKANLLLDSRESLLRGGDSGAAIVPGDPQNSLLVKALHSTDPDTAMPPKKAGGKLPASVIADLEHWIAAGAPWSGTGAAASSKQFDLAKRKQEHWCWKPPVAHAPPRVKNAPWVRGTADSFILSKLESESLSPAPPADRQILLRRLYFDLLGLPPTREQTEVFLADKRPDAVERLVDELLNSPHFGERWARHWMDLVRYGESRGHELNPTAPNVWQYRDYLIRAFNADVPYTQFVLEHIAGDLVTQRLNPENGACESVLGTGFWYLGEEVHSPVDPRQDELDRVDNQIDVMSKTFLGVTVACARCHDHKFDAISQRDYYALSGFVLSSNRRLVRFETLEQDAAISRRLDAWKSAARPALLKSTAAAMRPALRELAQHLDAARNVDPAKLDDAKDRAAAWKKALLAAQKTPEDPLHPLAEALLLPAATPPQKTQSVLARALSKSRQQAPDFSGWRVLADFSTAHPREWMQDGFAFGAGPARLGEPTLGTSAERPITGLLTLTSARREPVFFEILAKGAPSEGALKAVQASGQMLRTAEFTVQSGHLLYLLRGGAKVFTPINSHHFVQGPLHGKTVLPVKATDQWQWVAHNLSAYSGLRTHVEFAPDGNGELEIALVLEAEGSAEAAPPPAPALPHAASALARSLAHRDLPATSSELATVLTRTLEKTLDALAEDKLDETATATLANWMVSHWDLFSPQSEQDRAALSTAAKPHLETWQKIQASVRKESAVALAMMDGSGVDEMQLKRGSPKLPLQPVPRRMLEALAGPEPIDAGAGSGRLRLAEHIIAPSNPLTARVIVNRVWHHLFGRGIVPSVDNFGVLGQPPSHPELLDTLAVEFVQKHHWSLKKLIRSLVLSSTYQMGSKPSDTLAEEKDPENTLLHRMNLKRLQGEAIRDAILTVSNRLNRQQGGPSIPPFLTPFMEGRGRPAGGPLDGHGRRSVYVAVIRNFLSPMMLAFDTPIPFSTMGKRNVSNVPDQALFLMNDPFVADCAKTWSTNLLRINSHEERLRDMVLRVFNREPLPEETREALAFVRTQAEQLKAATPNDSRIWADLAHVLFTAKEFIHLQ